MSITLDQGRRVFALEIAGLEYRYHSINPPASTNLNANLTTGFPYTDIEAIVAVGAFNSEIDPSGGVAQYSALSIELSILKDGLSSDPGIVFGRVGKRSEGVNRANLEESITFDSLPQTINIDKDLTSITAPALMHIGSETFKVSAFTSASMTISERAIADTPYQSHVLSLQGTSVPIVEDKITIFRGRRCKLFVASQDSDGNVGDYSCIINGFIESSPYVENGDTVSLSVIPLTALLDTKLTDSKEGSTFLLQNYHYYSNINSNVFEYGSAWNRRFAFKIWDVTVQSPTVSRCQITNGISLADVFDKDLPNGTEDNVTMFHPRFPLLQHEDAVLYPIAYGFSSNVQYIDVDHSIPGSAQYPQLAAIVAGDGRWRIKPRGEIKRYQLGSNEVKRWPDVINEILDSDGPSSHTGIDGANHLIRINNQFLIASSLADQRPGHEGQVHLWYSSMWPVTSPKYDYAYWPSEEIEIRGRLSNERRVFYPLDYWMDGSKPNYAGESSLVKVVELPEGKTTSTSIPVKIAKAYKQANERFILVEDSLGLPSSFTAGVTFGIEVETFDYYEERQKVLTFEATHQSQVTFDSVNVGYLIHLSSNRENALNGHFGDWGSEERTVVKRGLLSFYVTPGEFMLKLLQSGGGGNNGSYDDLGVGLSIHQDNIDVDSFLRNGSATVAALQRGFSVDDFDPRDFFDSLLRMLGCILIMKRSSAGIPKITLQPIGTETEDLVSQIISAGDFLADPPPTWSIYEDIVTQVAVEYNWNNDNNEFLNTIIFNNQEAINRYGGEKSKISIELYGVQTEDIGEGTGDPYNYFLPVASRIFNIMSNPMRLWTGSIGTGKSIFLEVGSYVKVTSPHLKSFDDSYGVTNEIGMVRSISQELMSEGCDLEIIKTGIVVVNWNSTMKVTASPTTTTLTVSTNTFSDDDTAFFAAGDVVDFLPFGDEDNAITGLTIQSIAGSTVTFTAAHGVSTLGTLEPTVYTSASADHKQDAYLASAAGVLGSSDDAQEYA